MIQSARREIGKCVEGPGYKKKSNTPRKGRGGPGKDYSEAVSLAAMMVRA